MRRVLKRPSRTSRWSPAQFRADTPIQSQSRLGLSSKAKAFFCSKMAEPKSWPQGMSFALLLGKPMEWRTQVRCHWSTLQLRHHPKILRARIARRSLQAAAKDPLQKARSWQIATKCSAQLNQEAQYRNERWRSAVIAPDVVDTGRTMALIGLALFIVGFPFFLGLAEASFRSAILIASCYLGLSLVVSAVFAWSSQTGQGLAFAILLIPAYLAMSAAAWCAGRSMNWLIRRWRG